jgi:small-conductance mechanosensitive channel
VPFLDDLWTTEVYGNGLIAWGIAFLTAIVVYVGLLTIRRVIIVRIARRALSARNIVGRVIGAAADATGQFFVIALALGVFEYQLALPAAIGRVVSAAVTIAIMVQLGLWCTAALGLWLSHYVGQRAAQNPASASAAQVIKLLALIAIWSALLLVTLGNFGIDISGLIAGLGIGGIAIAFALQSILKDLFASLAIVLDKPFVVGDFIIFGEQLGSVERLGRKTTRVRSLWGEQITVSNDDLLNTRVRNYKRMQERRVSFNITVTFEPPIESLRKIPQFIATTIKSIEGSRFDRSHVAAFEENGSRIETVYYVLSPDYNIYMDIQQRINFEIARYFDRQGIRFAYPARRLVQDSVRESRASSAG